MKSILGSCYFYLTPGQLRGMRLNINKIRKGRMAYKVAIEPILYEAKIRVIVLSEDFGDRLLSIIKAEKELDKERR